MRRWCHAFALLIAAAHPLAAMAQDYPNKPIRVIASQGAGGISDICMRIVGEELHKSWGQPLVVEDRAGRPVQHRRQAPAPKRRPTATPSASFPPSDGASIRFVYPNR